MRERIKESPCDELLTYIFRPAIAYDLQESYQSIVAINKAHVMMLAEEGIITKETAKKILEVTLDIERMQNEPKFAIDTDKEDLYFNMEKYLIDQTDLHIGGQQHTARSRNDLLATITRINTRTQYFKLAEIFLKLRTTILEAVEKNTQSIMSGYTHLQPSEPSTFGAYLSAISSALERDYARFQNAYASLNLCPLGGCAVASTSFAINRNTTADLLGFDAPIANSIDCVASRDYALEIVNALAMMSNTLSRMAQDLYVWATPDFNYIEVGGCTAACSSIMPQKKNPITLEHIKAKAAHLEGFYVSLFSSMKNVAFTHSRDISSEAIRFFWYALKEAEAQMQLTIPTIKTLQVNQDVMLKKAGENFCTVTELANYLVRYDGISFRAAHEIVGSVVVKAMAKHLTALEINRTLVNETCLELFSKETSLNDELINKALDPVLNVAAKKYEGGSAEEEVNSQLQKLRTALAKDNEILAARKEKIKSAEQKLNTKITEFQHS